MTTVYEVIGAVGKGEIEVRSDRFGTQKWGLAKLTYRKAKEGCAICGQTVGRFAYRPRVGGPSGRKNRICRRHVGEGLAYEDACNREKVGNNDE